ncbi:hypothetical protein ACTXN7_03585 [Corynebacterium flavescens]|uniref:hypothetical protein n=1 Tax=Corynebacterium flavescens TaxID=28028 RepID=UPI003FCFD1E0
MSFRRKPNPNRNHPGYCPYCAGTSLFPDEEGEFAWKCTECLRVFSVLFHGQDDAPTAPVSSVSSAEALQLSLRRRGHRTAVSTSNREDDED